MSREFLVTRDNTSVDVYKAFDLSSRINTSRPASACCAPPSFEHSGDFILVVRASEQRHSCCDLHMWKANSGPYCAAILRSSCLKAAQKSDCLITAPCRNWCSVAEGWRWRQEDGSLSRDSGPAPCKQKSIRRICEAIFSFPDNLSRNIKDSLTTVNVQLILEWHSDVSLYSFILQQIHTLDFSWVSLPDIYKLCAAAAYRDPLYPAQKCDEMLINQTVFSSSIKFALCIQMVWNSIFHVNDRITDYSVFFLLFIHVIVSICSPNALERYLCTLIKRTSPIRAAFTTKELNICVVCIHTTSCPSKVI